MTLKRSWTMPDVVFHRIDRDQIVERLQAYAGSELADRPEVRQVVLMGSLARGTWSARSDADVVVVVDRAEGPGPFRGVHYLPSGSVGVGVDVFVYTPDELAATSARFRAEVAAGLVLFNRAGG
jgi:predicted nucleotidyltransferase